MASQPEDMVRVVSLDDHASVEGATTPSPETVESLYRTQVLARTFDEKAVSLHRQGRVGTYAPLRGQEAAQVGAASALAERDYCFPTYRDHAMYLARGLALEEVLLNLMGQGNYVDGEDPGTTRTLPPTIPIATQLPHAVGAGMAATYRGDDVAALVSFGDGATSEGDFHEAMNFAGVFDAPVVFLCQNNGYAISVPTDRQTASATIAEKAAAYGFEGVRVDGNDVLAVRQVVADALAKAKRGEGPTLVEAVTYRRGAHTTTDDPSRYRSDEEVAEWRDQDPVERTREYLEAEAGWTDADEEALREQARETVADAVAAAEAHEGLTLDDLFENVYAAAPAHLRAQRERVPDEPAVDR